MITVKREMYHECIAEMKVMYPAHYEELSLNKEMPLNPIYEIYDRLASAGVLHVIAVRDDGALIGYLMYLISPNLHYGGIEATEDIYYLKPEYRGRMIGSRMCETFEQEARKDGANRARMATKVHKDNSLIFERKGWKEHERVFVKVL